jgi:Mg2+-importing ATPase
MYGILLDTAVVVHMIRTPKLPFIESRPSAVLLATTGLIVAVGLFLPMGPLASHFELQPLPYFVLLPLILLGYAARAQLMKRAYSRRFGWQ